MLPLIGLQDVTGAWTDPAKVQALCGVTMSCPTVLAGNQTAFATALAIALLRRVYIGHQSQWLMIERKALLWLTKQAIDAEAVIAELARQLSSGTD
jgi:hypothetical protein